MKEKKWKQTVWISHCTILVQLPGSGRYIKPPRLTSKGHPSKLSVHTKERDLWEKPHGRVTQMRPLLRKKYENTSVVSENAWKSVVEEDFCGHLRPERSFCTKFQSDMWATNLKNHTYNEVLLQGSMGRRWSTMLRSCFSSAGTGSILKIKGSLEEYKIQGNCLLQDNLFF